MTNRLAPSKAETATLPPFEGLPLARIHVPATPADFDAAAAAIAAAGTVGFDTESKPTFVTGDVSEGPHVVQFATATDAYIFQVHRREGRPQLLALLQSEAVLKVGFGLSSDHGQIHANLGIRLRAVLDLNRVFRREGYGSSLGVRAAVGLALKQRFHKSKKITTTNWSMPRLTEKQLLYAANDAYAALMVLQALDLPREALPVTGLGGDADEANADAAEQVRSG
jgi:ribonuclease D